MNRRDALLAILAAGGGKSFTPAQIQKAVFLVTRNAPQLVTEGHNFSFVPYDYGPFDAGVYREAEALAGQGLAAVVPNGRWMVYAATQEGVERGKALLSTAAPAYREYVERVATWVLQISFATLVKSIYEAYPEMRQNSIFQD